MSGCLGCSLAIQCSGSYLGFDVIERINIDAWVVGGKLCLVPNSSDPEGSAVLELPPEVVDLSASTVAFGSAVLRAAERCREGFGLKGFDSDAAAVALGFKSNAELVKKAIGFGIGRRGGAVFLVTAYKRVKGKLVFDDEDFECPIADVNAVGECVKRMAVSLSSG